LAAVSTAALAVTAGNPAWSEDAAKPAATPVPGAVKIPESAGKVDQAKLMEQGPLKDIVMGKADAPV
ncbi:hypothetical protein NY536_26610, partial [Enterobacter hormaechei]|nr:hypothetical protein [Enterobacter hormaechei]